MDIFFILLIYKYNMIFLIIMQLTENHNLHFP